MTEGYADTPEPPYVAVIFTSRQKLDSTAGYADMAARMNALAAGQNGFLGMESVHDAEGFGITVSYWRDLAAVHAWKQHADHLAAQTLGRERWYADYRVRIAQVERAYAFR